MSKNKLQITYKKERAVLSDILPYETPVIFSNRYLYRFLTKNKMEINSKELIIVWKDDSPIIGEVVKLLFNAKVIDDHSAKLYYDYHKQKKYALKSIPFRFKIAHKNNDYRELSIIHPLNQLHLVELYDVFKETIKYYSNISHYSIRKPYKVANYRFKNDYLHKKFKKNSLANKLEIYGSEEEHLKSFFSYNKYSNIHKFFESYQYQRSEKKFQELYKFDISKCFESIYTHSIAWALYNKDIVKDNIASSNSTFAGLFDIYMQNINYGETNGILVGSEFARIFAELLLQQIDKMVYEDLLKEKTIHKKDYELYRYVDDYFLYYDDDKTRDKILNLYKHKLKEFNLHISDTKSRQYKKPIITELTIAKTKITDLINEYLSIKTIDNSKEESPDKPVREWKVYFKANSLITRFKIIIKETEIEYKDILNYTIAIVERKVIKHFNKFEKEEENKELYTRGFIAFNIEITDFIFFIYSVSPRVSSTIKMASLLSKMIEFIKNCKELKHYEKERIYKKIFDEIYQVLDKNKVKKYTQNETLYLLLILNELGRNYRLEENFLIKYFFHEQSNILNYFSITTLLFYIKNTHRYSSLKQKILEHVKQKFDSFNPDNLQKDTELTILLFDLIACPYIELDFKKELLEKFGMAETQKQEDIVSFQKYWFIKWEDFNLVDELEMKKSQEVYS